VAKLEKEKAVLEADGRHKIAHLQNQLDQSRERNRALCQDLKTLERMLVDLEKAHKSAIGGPHGQRRVLATIQANLKALKKSTADSLKQNEQSTVIVDSNGTKDAKETKENQTVTASVSGTRQLYPR
jgi:hypothetical protein